MATTYTRPDVYIEEILTPDNTPEGVSTSIASFLGATVRGPSNKAILITSFDEFKRVFGGALDKEPLFYTVRSFFDNGGSACYVVRVVSDAAITGGQFAKPANDTILGSNSDNDALKFSAGYRGLPSYGIAGKGLYVNINQSSLFTSDATNGDLVDAVSQDDTSIKVRSTTGIRPKDFIKVVGHKGEVDYLQVAAVRSVLNGSSLEHFIDLVTACDNGTGLTTGVNSSITVLAYDVIVKTNSAQVTVETFTGVSMNPESDLYIETIINDEETGSRYITVEDLVASTTPSSDAEIKESELASELDHRLATNGEDVLPNFAISDFIGDEVNQTGMYALAAKDSVNLLCIPPSLDSATGILKLADVPKVQAAMLDFCAKRLDMFAILDAPSGRVMSTSATNSIGLYRTGSLGVDSFFGAMYYPHLKVQKTSGSRQTITIPPSGAVAGLYSRVDAIGAPDGGVASSPAGYGDLGLIRNVSGLEFDVSDSLHGELNTMGINVIKIVERANGALPGALVLGARTLSNVDEFRYINTRRMMTFVEKNIKRLGKPYLFRNNGPRLWRELTSDIESFLREEFQAGNLAGNSVNESFFVKINATTNTAENIKKGILVGEIGVALLRPAEFVVFRFSQTQAGSQEV